MSRILLGIGYLLLLFLWISEPTLTMPRKHFWDRVPLALTKWQRTVNWVIDVCKTSPVPSLGTPLHDVTTQCPPNVSPSPDSLPSTEPTSADHSHYSTDGSYTSEENVPVVMEIKNRIIPVCRVKPILRTN